MLMLRGRAEWEPFWADNKICGFYCSKCFHSPRGEFGKFCPNCGRKMIHSVLIIEMEKHDEPKDGEVVGSD